jgi:hypothetical protein
MDLAIPRKVEIEVGGEKLAHYFRELPTREWLSWQRKIGELGDDALEKIALWYDEHIAKVEGYVYNGVDIMALSYPLPSPSTGEGKGEGAVSDWKSLIPGAHKIFAWNEYLTGDELKKKSSTISTSSPTPPSDAPEK